MLLPEVRADVPGARGGDPQLVRYGRQPQCGWTVEIKPRKAPLTLLDETDTMQAIECSAVAVVLLVPEGWLLVRQSTGRPTRCLSGGTPTSARGDRDAEALHFVPMGMLVSSEGGSGGVLCVANQQPTTRRKRRCLVVAGNQRKIKADKDEISDRAWHSIGRHRYIILHIPT